MMFLVEQIFWLMVIIFLAAAPVVAIFWGSEGIRWGFNTYPKLTVLVLVLIFLSLAFVIFRFGHDLRRYRASVATPASVSLTVMARNSGPSRWA